MSITIFVVIQLVAVMLVFLGWWWVRRTTGRIRVEQFPNDLETYQETGGARVDSFNVTVPFATFVADRSKLAIIALGRTYVLEESQIRELRRYSGIVSTGIQVKHDQAELPEFLVFWTFRFGRLAGALRALGFEVSE